MSNFKIKKQKKESIATFLNQVYSSNLTRRNTAATARTCRFTKPFKHFLFRHFNL